MYCLIILFITIDVIHIGAGYLQGRIIGGSSASILDYPYAVSIQFSGSHICGGSIISETRILSAAHCIRYPSEIYQIRAGSTYVSSGGQIINTNQIIIHPSYNRRNADCDISILFLSYKLTYGSSIKPIGLPFYNQFIPSGWTSVVVGWGTTEINDPSLITERIRKVYLKTLRTTSCADLYPTNSITSNMICGVSDKKEDTCNGDSGGPMVANNLLIGIVSWGMSCVDPMYPGVYTSVATQINFITNYTSI